MEMLVVLMIVGLIVGIVGPRVFGAANKGRIKTAQAQVKLLRSAIDSMQLDIGRYPTQEEGLALLSTKPTDPALAARWQGPYLQEEVPADPWGHPYVYAVPGANGQPFALYSMGADGKRGGEGEAQDIGVLPATP